ncbi:Alpha-1,3-mannosyl-glycoprotein 2-beta-N-acetylglucosaminyltransferase [Chrysochromulina tobinii]|uniref:alpha-1,3-mannosyl-glycoprotein 2-beta-N-acetylglucosaminyltransferase n=1 Tax=Chrysochromulina tobinii TaxID=1460289 RepID=A0A0M0J4S6_9EUKA|nr:Alpha-1,3-mannosyl-glycoprotein 2-beta-N-acetylglucosaminyltransferase [Chrysochromulina tobinii]|eukprot:KOO21581.1 Alpha-1,3-mannosyl-glycoprotein 2-beta-N-acetylglucosaminyltransferase [Chrysochromulina sp. CCMP291]
MQGPAPYAFEVAPSCSSDPSVGCMARPAIVVMSHNRPDMTRRCLKLLLSLPLIEHFTLYVSEDAGSVDVQQAAKEFGGAVKEVFSYPPTHPTPGTFSSRPMYKISQHFKLALEATLTKRGHSHAVMIEDDLLLSPDFLRLFWASAWLLRADRSLWCVSAWNDQGFPHTARSASRLQRTDYFPGLGWMISADIWHELRDKWPEAATTGWDHWMRLSTTTRGRECVVPEINRSRHASSHGTNVVDNTPFERFTFEKQGVDSFGDLSYLLQAPYEKVVHAAVEGAQQLEWPTAWGGATDKEAALPWMARLPKERASLLLYTREEYRQLAKPLGIWEESQRATHNGTITLRTPNGATLLLADRRKCPYLPEGLQLRPPKGMQTVAAEAGVSCDVACRQAGARCDMKTLEWGNSCAAMAAHFGCERGCGHQVGPELPAYAASPDLDTYQQCLISDIAISQCAAGYAKTRRLCTCAPAISKA